MEPPMSIVALGVTDLKRSREFYERLGWRKSMAKAEGIVSLQPAGMALAFYPRHELAKDANVAAHGQGLGGISLAYNTRNREEVDSVVWRIRRASMPAGFGSDQRVLLQELLAAGMNPIFMAAGPSMQKQEQFSRTVCLLKHVDTVDLRASSFHGCSMAAGAPTNKLGNATVIMDNPVTASAVEHLCPRLVFHLRLG